MDCLLKGVSITERLIYKNHCELDGNNQWTEHKRKSASIGFTITRMESLKSLSKDWQSKAEETNQK